MSNKSIMKYVLVNSDKSNKKNIFFKPLLYLSPY